MGAGYEAIRQLLDGTRRRLQRVALAEGLLVLLSALLALLLLLFGLQTLDWLGRFARIFAAVAVVSSLIYCVRRFIVLPRRAHGSDEFIARYVSGRADHLSSHLLSAVQFQREMPRMESEQRVSPQLARAHIQWTSEHVGEVDPQGLVPWRRLRPQAGIAGGLAAIAIALAIIWPATMGAAAGALFGFGGALGGALRGAGVMPLMGDITLVYHYPEYTGLAPRTVPGSDGRITALTGTEVEITTRADRQVDSAAITFDDDEVSVPMTVRGGQLLRGRVVVMKDGRYRFRITDTSGAVASEAEGHPVVVEEDLHPEVNLREPQLEELEVDETDRVELRYDTRDDFGLREIALVYRIFAGEDMGGPDGEGSLGADEGRKVIRSFSSDPKIHDGDYGWELSELKLGPGDRVAYFLEVTDNDVISGPKKGTSATKYLKVYSALERRQELMEKQKQLWERMVIVLADDLVVSTLPDDGSGMDRAALAKQQEATLGEWARVDKSLDELDVRIDALVTEMTEERSKDGGVDIDDRVRQALINIRKDLREATQAKRRQVQRIRPVLGRGGVVIRKQIQNAVLAWQDEVAELEKGVLYLDDMMNQLRLEELSDLADRLKDRQATLQDLMQRYKEAPDDATRKAIEREVARLKKEIMELMRKMAELRKGVADDYINPEAAERMDMMNSLDEITEALNSGDMEKALQEMERLQQMMENMMQELDRAKEEYGGDEYAELRKEMENFYNDLKDMEQRQNLALDKNEQVSKAMREEQEKRLKEREGGAEKFVQDQVKKIEDAMERLNQNATDRDRMNPSHQKAEARMQDTRDMLGASDFEEARQMAQKTVNQLRNLERQREAEAKRQSRAQQRINPKQAAADDAKASREKMEEVAKELESLFPDPKELMSEQDRKQAQKLAEDQQQMQQQAQQIGQKMEKIGEQAPVFSPEMHDMLKQAGQQMGQAGNQLGQNNPRGALPHQRGALDQLGQLRQSLEEMGQNQQQGGGSGGMPLPWAQAPQQNGNRGQNGRSPRNNQKVEIPNPDDYKAPKELREDILKAMKEQVPEGFKPQVKRYYEDLVR